MDPRPNQHQLSLSVLPENIHTIHFSLALVKLLCKSNISCLICGDPYRIRTDVNGVRGRCLNHLTNGPCRRKKLRSIPFGFRQSSQRSVLPPLSSVNASLGFCSVLLVYLSSGCPENISIILRFFHLSSAFFAPRLSPRTTQRSGRERKR